VFFANSTPLAESLGLLAIVLNFVAYRQDKINHYRVISAFALLSLSFHFFLIDAMAAGIACMLSVFRNMVAIRTQATWVVVLFVGLNLVFCAYEWWLGHGWIIVLAYTSSIIFTVGSIVLQSANTLRLWFIWAESLGLSYAVLMGSISGSLFNLINLTSIFIKHYQYRKHIRGMLSEDSPQKSPD
jgi:hypothetical protein